MSRSLLALLPMLLAADWREFRGPDGVGVYSGPPIVTEWGPDTNVAWATPIPGLGWSSPVLVGDTLFLTTAVADSPDQPTQFSLRALALQADSGQVIWDKELFTENVSSDPAPHRKNSRASPTPVTDGTHVWVHFGHMGTACLTTAGDIVWRSQEHRYKPVHGNGASPILMHNLIVFPCDGDKDPYLTALDAATGKTRWTTPRNTNARLPFSFATCQIVNHNGTEVLVSPAADYCLGLDPATGAEKWRVKYPRPGWSLISRPVYTNGLVVIGTGYTSQHLIAFPPEGEGDITASIAWQTARNAPNTPTPVAVGAELYVVSDAGVLTCFDAKTGQVHYAERLAGRAYSASPVVINNTLYVTSEDGIGQTLTLGTKFEPLTKSDMGERTFATFVPAAGALYVRTASKLYKFVAK